MRRIVKTLAIIFIVIFGISLFVLSNHIAGWRAFVVLSSSMEPTFNTGSLVVTQKIHPTNLKKGDIITFINPTNIKEFVTHRIVNVKNNGSVVAIKTKGDNNNSEDPWVLAGGGVVGKVVYTIPYLGYVMSFARTKIAIALFILIPAIYIIFDEINNIIKLFKNRKKKNLENITTVGIIIIIFLQITFFSSQNTFALLSDTVSLQKNSIKVIAYNCNNRSCSRECNNKRKDHDKDLNYKPKDCRDDCCWQNDSDFEFNMSDDRKKIIFLLKKLRNFRKISYKLTYFADNILQGVSGSSDLGNQDVFTRSIDLGTCSSNNRCVYYKEIKNLKLEVELRDNDDRHFSFNKNYP